MTYFMQIKKIKYKKKFQLKVRSIIKYVNDWQIV